ncbi:MAG: hypothetical protein KDA46_06220, partial [Parvularculaceae bacterium]|nr:hypothetical protein [Parvularculaceae bacterium]
DGVELGAHMSYFLSSFLSPRTNWREDEYGGGTENRARIVCNIIRQIRVEAGPDFPIGVRMCVNEQVEGGQGPAGYAEIAAEFEKAGADYIAMTNGGYEKMNLSLPMRDGALVESGEPTIMRKAVSIPLLMQSVHEPSNAASYISAGHADMVMLARQMLADPDYANKVRDGRLNDIIWCNRENVCLRRLMMDMPVKCPLNPRSGIESHPPGAARTAGQMLQDAKEAFLLTVTKSRTVTKIGMRLKGH